MLTSEPPGATTFKDMERRSERSENGSLAPSEAGGGTSLHAGVGGVMQAWAADRPPARKLLPGRTVLEDAEQLCVDPFDKRQNKTVGIVKDFQKLLRSCGIKRKHASHEVTPDVIARVVRTKRMQKWEAWLVRVIEELMAKEPEPKLAFWEAAIASARASKKMRLLLEEKFAALAGRIPADTYEVRQQARALLLELKGQRVFSDDSVDDAIRNYNAVCATTPVRVATGVTTLSREEQMRREKKRLARIAAVEKAKAEAGIAQLAAPSKLRPEHGPAELSQLGMSVERFRRKLERGPTRERQTEGGLVVKGGTPSKRRMREDRQDDCKRKRLTALERGSSTLLAVPSGWAPAARSRSPSGGRSDDADVDAALPDTEIAAILDESLEILTGKPSEARIQETQEIANSLLAQASASAAALLGDRPGGDDADSDGELAPVFRKDDEDDAASSLSEDAMDAAEAARILRGTAEEIDSDEEADGGVLLRGRSETAAAGTFSSLPRQDSVGGLTQRSASAGRFSFSQMDELLDEECPDTFSVPAPSQPRAASEDAGRALDLQWPANQAPPTAAAAPWPGGAVPAFGQVKKQRDAEKRLKEQRKKFLQATAAGRLAHTAKFKLGEDGDARYLDASYRLKTRKNVELVDLAEKEDMDYTDELVDLIERETTKATVERALRLEATAKHPTLLQPPQPAPMAPPSQPPQNRSQAQLTRRRCVLCSRAYKSASGRSDKCPECRKAGK
ncbi:hypothetical protein DIPPA_12347 [Diplonema papillatum]|nr:hypothetical protein DIPPA_12347 [Diplonema papillatum]